MTRTVTCLVAMALVTGIATAARAQGLSPADAGVGAAKGKVVSSANEPQAGVPVQIHGPLGQTVAITDKTGTWSLYNLPAGEYKVHTIGSQKSKAPESVDFTVKDGTFWEKFSGASQKVVVWTPDITIDKPATPVP